MSAADVILNTIVPNAKLMSWAFLFLVVVIPVGWYFLVFKKQRTWIANIWERSQQGLIRTGTDVVVEKKIPGENAHKYLLRKRKYLVAPVSAENVIFVGRKRYVDYLREGSDYVPLRRKLSNVDKDVLEYVLIPYDIQMMVLSTYNMLKRDFSNKPNFVERYQMIIGMGMFVVLIIVIMSFYFDSINAVLGDKIDSATGVLQNLAGQITGK